MDRRASPEASPIQLVAGRMDAGGCSCWCSAAGTGPPWLSSSRASLSQRPPRMPHTPDWARRNHQAHRNQPSGLRHRRGRRSVGRPGARPRSRGVRLDDLVVPARHAPLPPAHGPGGPIDGPCSDRDRLVVVAQAGERLKGQLASQPGSARRVAHNDHVGSVCQHRPKVDARVADEPDRTSRAPAWRHAGPSPCGTRGCTGADRSGDEDVPGAHDGGEDR